MAVLLNAQSLSKSFDSRHIFSGLTFGVQDGERLGIIGPNGSGKSTLLKILAGMEQPSDGSVISKRSLRLAYVPQEVAFPEGSTPEEVLSKAVEDEHLNERELSIRINSTLGKFGFEPGVRTRPIQECSGGWRKRVAIAQALVRNPELLLLDEPTNHLDMEGIQWLEELLANSSFASVFITHDRYFLEQAANRIFELNRRYPEGFFSTEGAYSDFLLRREDFLAGQLSMQKSLASVVRREAEWLKKGPRGRLAKSTARADEARKLISDLAVAKSRNSDQGAAKLDFTSSERQANKLLVLKNVSKKLGDRSVLTNASMVLSPGMKLGILGENGSGKTTLLRLLAGHLEPDSGSIERAEKLRLVYFDQNREQLDPDMTLLRALCPSGETVHFRNQSIHISSWAKRFLFQADQLPMPLRNLSGGEQARVLIARLMLQPADLLLLDEPTNDLDIPTLEVLEESISEFPGAVVLVTHDRYLLRRVSTEILGLFGDGTAMGFSDYDQWETAKLERAEAQAAAKKAQEPKAAPSGESAKKPKKLSYKEQREWDQMEATILETETLVQKIQHEIESPEIAQDRVRLQERCQALSEAQHKVETLYARWQELEAKQA